MNTSKEAGFRDRTERLRSESPGGGVIHERVTPMPAIWRRRALLCSLFIASTGMITVGVVRSVSAQVAAAEAPQPPGGPERSPFAPVKVGRYYINITAICCAYWSAPGPGETRSFVVEFGTGTRVILSEDEGRELTETFLDIHDEGPFPAQPDGPAAPPAPAP